WGGRAKTNPTRRSMKIIRGRLVAGLIVCAALQVSAAARAEPPKQAARALFDEGKRLFEQHHYAAAVQSYLQAYEMYPLPALFINVAQAYEKMGRIEDAIRYYDRYLAAPHPAQRARFRARRDQLARSLGTERVAAPAVSPPPAEPDSA